MHRRHASSIFLCAVILAACGGRIAQGPVGDSDEVAPSDLGADASTTMSTFDAAVLSTACGATTCPGNDECCVGAPLSNVDPNAALERCSDELCNTELEVDCWTSGQCAPGDVCCITIDPSTNYPSATCASSCGGTGTPAVQACAADDECPSGFGCFVASMGVAGKNQNVEICGGVR
jgi:hypothetical protein